MSIQKFKLRMANTVINVDNSSVKNVEESNIMSLFNTIQKESKIIFFFANSDFLRSCGEFGRWFWKWGKRWKKLGNWQSVPKTYVKPRGIRLGLV